ncbi:serine hydrolase domain-containing protein [Alkalihalobacterium elongatum]|uniref:serine hydrolase domain-containing protein n=1 Tax=Alkalihalobacterium elongatum TaxID=2675466 RepID=UPI001C1F9278|nr:serine hydrolase domain-containing protein [Alkalihalobacterium elongatum]
MIKQIDEYLSNKPNFSGSVLIAKKGEVIFNKAFGFADIEKRVKNTTKTRFSTASAISKPVTAIATLQLIEHGILSLSQKIGIFFPQYKKENITIHHLLNHTSGIPNYLMIRRAIDTTKEYTPKEILNVVHTKGLRFIPGKKFSYNNTGFLMLGLIIEQVLGTSYEQYVKENIFEPAGMKDTGFERDNLENTARNHIKGRVGKVFHPSLMFACGEVHSTVEDVYKLDRALKDNYILSEELVKMMEESSYSSKWISIGYPWLIKNQFQRRSIAHAGTHPGGYVSHYERYIDDDVTIIVLSNNMVKHAKLSMKEIGATLISRELAEIIFMKNLRFWQKFL